MDLIKAEADRAVLQKREAQLVTELEAVRAQLAKLQNFLELSSRYMGLSKKKRSPVRSGNGVCILGAALNTLRQAGRPMTIGELLKTVTASGIEIGGKRPSTNLSSILSRSDKVTFTRGVGWHTVETEGRKPCRDKK